MFSFLRFTLVGIESVDDDEQVDAAIEIGIAVGFDNADVVDAPTEAETDSDVDVG